LELYMSQKFCVELILFYKDCREFQMHFASLSEQQEMGKQIMAKFFDPTAECEINISWSAKQAVYETLKQHQSVFAADIFDQCMREVLDLIRNNIWLGFRSSIQKIAVIHDVYYEEIQDCKSRAAFMEDDESDEASPTSQSTESRSNSMTSLDLQSGHALPSGSNVFSFANRLRSRTSSRHRASIEESVTSAYPAEKYMAHEQ